MKFRDRIARFMQGRYGYDQLSYFMIGVYIVLIILSMIFRQPVPYLIFTLLAYADIILLFYRMMSRKVYKRSTENQKFLTLWAPVSRFYGLTKRRLKDHKTHRYYVCPQCKQTIRVPKGKGKIQITCPKCHHTFVKKT